MDHTSLNNFDYAVLAVILISGLLALMRGVMREIFSLIAWSGATFAAFKFYPLAEPWTRRYIANEDISSAAAGTLVFAVCFVVLTLTGSLISKLVKGDALTAIDRSLGFVFGILRGVLVVCLVYLMLITVLWPELDQDERPTLPNLSATKASAPTAEKDKNGKPPAPEWVMNARTRSFLAYGANELKTIIPAKEFQKKTTDYLQKKHSSLLPTPALPSGPLPDSLLPTTNVSQPEVPKTTP